MITDECATNSAHMLGVRIDNLPVEKLVQHIGTCAVNRQRVTIAYANIHAMNLAYEMNEFREFLNSCDIVYCDGFGVKLGARILGQRLQYRYTTPDWTRLLCEECIANDLSMFFLGGHEGVARMAAEKLQAQFPDLRIVGALHGYFNKSVCSEENRQVIEIINKQKPDILLVGFGMPVQEFWLRDNLSQIDTTIALTVGAGFDYVSEAVARAPQWVTDNGLEWLGRLAVEPRRLWRRYLVGNPLFFWRILRRRFSEYVK